MKYKLRISRKTVDKLGVKLYDKVALVIAELVSNAYDADATKVSVELPAGEFLATRKAVGVVDRGYTIEIVDDGIGMSPEQLDRYYLVVGSDRRTDARTGTSPSGRPVMGRKGVGKLAPFGICKTIEVISAGDTDVKPPETSKPFQVGHIILNYDAITEEDDYDYEPVPGPQDGTWTSKRGTTIILRDFLTRRVPPIPELAEEIAQRFGMLVGSGWSVSLKDNQKSESPVPVTYLNIPLMKGTKITFSGPSGPTLVGADDKDYGVTLENGEDTPLKAGFYQDARFYPIKGWIAYSEEPVKREIAVGVRIYCRGKFATQTAAFDIPSGFTGEFQVKSYLVGEIQCDWLDEDDDLIHTDRQNIQWSSDIGSGLRDWGRTLIREMGRQARKPAQEKTLNLFEATVDLDNELARRFPNKDQSEVKLRAKDLAQTLARKMSPADAKDTSAAGEVLSLASAFAPHMELSRELNRAAEQTDLIGLGMVADILAKAKMAESMTLGTIAEKRLRIIDRFQDRIRDPNSDEADLQRLVEEAPWLIRPDWTPISENRSLSTVRGALERYLTKVLKQEVTLSKIQHPTKRPDFIMIGAPGPLQLVEIKKAGHQFDSVDFARLWRYFEAFDDFFKEPANAALLEGIGSYKITLIADGSRLTSVEKNALANREKLGQFEQLSWDVLLGRTKFAHEDFIKALTDAGLKPGFDD